MIFQMTRDGLVAPVTDPDAPEEPGTSCLRDHVNQVGLILDSGRAQPRQRGRLAMSYEYLGREPVEQVVDRVRRLTGEHRQKVKSEARPRRHYAERAEILDSVIVYNGERAERMLRGERKAILATR